MGLLRSVVRFSRFSFIVVGLFIQVRVYEQFPFAHTIGHIFIFMIAHFPQLLPHSKVYDEIKIIDIKCIYIVIFVVNDSNRSVGINVSQQQRQQ